METEYRYLVLSGILLRHLFKNWEILKKFLFRRAAFTDDPIERRALLREKRVRTVASTTGRALVRSRGCAGRGSGPAKPFAAPTSVLRRVHGGCAAGLQRARWRVSRLLVKPAVKAICKTCKTVPLCSSRFFFGTCTYFSSKHCLGRHVYHPCS